MDEDSIEGQPPEEADRRRTMDHLRESEGAREEMGQQKGAVEPAKDVEKEEEEYPNKLCSVRFSYTNYLRQENKRLEEKMAEKDVLINEMQDLLEKNDSLVEQLKRDLRAAREENRLLKDEKNNQNTSHISFVDGGDSVTPSPDDLHKSAPPRATSPQTGIHSDAVKEEDDWSLDYHAEAEGDDQMTPSHGEVDQKDGEVADKVKKEPCDREEQGGHQVNDFGGFDDETEDFDGHPWELAPSARNVAGNEVKKETGDDWPSLETNADEKESRPEKEVKEEGEERDIPQTDNKESSGHADNIFNGVSDYDHFSDSPLVHNPPMTEDVVKKRINQGQATEKKTLKEALVLVLKTEVDEEEMEDYGNIDFGLDIPLEESEIVAKRKATKRKDGHQPKNHRVKRGRQAMGGNEEEGVMQGDGGMDEDVEEEPVVDVEKAQRRRSGRLALKRSKENGRDDSEEECEESASLPMDAFDSADDEEEQSDDEMDDTAAADDPTDQRPSEKECPVDGCSEKFSSLEDLVEHMKGHPKPLNGKICQKSFPFPSNLRQHHFEVHMKEKSFACPTCKKRFSRAGKLKEHQRIHTGERPFKCDICGAQFTQLCNLKTHMLTHTGQRPFECTICGHFFSRNVPLKEHMAAVHTVEKKYACEQCNYRTAYSTHLSRHKKTMHHK